MKPLRLLVVEDNPDDEALVLLSDASMPDFTALARGFERFGRAVGSRSSGGLGLYLARRAAEAHGGRARAEMREGGGARSTLELPLEKEERT
jgi:signal transduction histidine kinase